MNKSARKPRRRYALPAGGDLQDWNTPADVGRYFRCSADTVYGLCSSGRISFARIGPGKGTIRIRREWVMEFERANTHRAASAVREEATA